MIKTFQLEVFNQLIFYCFFFNLYFLLVNTFLPCTHGHICYDDSQWFWSVAEFEGSSLSAEGTSIDVSKGVVYIYGLVYKFLTLKLRDPDSFPVW